MPSLGTPFTGPKENYAWLLPEKNNDRPNSEQMLWRKSCIC